MLNETENMMHQIQAEIPLTIILLISVIFQAMAAIIAVSQVNIIKGNYRIAWACLSLALLLMVERRLAPLWRLLEYGQPSSLIDANFGLAISIFMLVGNYGVWKLFKHLELQRIKLDKLARQDELTGLDNRRSILEKARFEINRSLRTRHQIAFLMLDIDYFKSVNDRFGHAAGDRVLRQIAEISGRELRNIDTCGRIGGEEFLIVMPDTNLQDALVAAERLRAAISAYDFHLSDKPLPITISIGVVVTSLGKVLDVDELLLAVDKALYKAKNNGRNRVEVG